MKKLFFLAGFMLLVFFSLSACTKDVQDNLDDIAGTAKTNVQNTKDYIAEKIALEEKLALLEVQKQKFSLPSRAKQLNITTPEGMTLDQNSSYQTSEEVEGFNSMRFVYTGDYNLAMKQAEIIAQKAGVQISEEFKLAQDTLKKMGKNTLDQLKDMVGDLKGVVYTNYSIIKNPETDQIISISVEEDGTLEIVVVDRKNMQNVVLDKIK
ncbi:MAG TPA: hypothetical protein PK674_02615 [Candidatus Absconditabacterales bacterium]|nr:hypothetical protein [Candidatus Absconditabacterales bacterium]HOQ79248.1 hypothetical protein [Candidatus Absconditabacterales bacterium]HPK28114.1 hypothetical protein [Candidatus Absconditabacterales bacterium]